MKLSRIALLLLFLSLGSCYQAGNYRIVFTLKAEKYGLNLLLRDSSIVLFGTVGLLYIMFTTGLEIEMEEFKKTRFKSFVFGLVTFLLPIAFGGFAAVYILDFRIITG